MTDDEARRELARLEAQLAASQAAVEKATGRVKYWEGKRTEKEEAGEQVPESITNCIAAARSSLANAEEHEALDTRARDGHKAGMQDAGVALEAEE